MPVPAGTPVATTTDVDATTVMVTRPAFEMSFSADHVMGRPCPGHNITPIAGDRAANAVVAAKGDDDPDWPAEEPHAATETTTWKSAAIEML